MEKPKFTEKEKLRIQWSQMYTATMIKEPNIKKILDYALEESEKQGYNNCIKDIRNLTPQWVTDYGDWEELLERIEELKEKDSESN